MKTEIQNIKVATELLKQVMGEFDKAYNKFLVDYPSGTLPNNQMNVDKNQLKVMMEAMLYLKAEIEGQLQYISGPSSIIAIEIEQLSKGIRDEVSSKADKVDQFLPKTLERIQSPSQGKSYNKHLILTILGDIVGRNFESVDHQLQWLKMTQSFMATDIESLQYLKKSSEWRDLTIKVNHEIEVAQFTKDLLDSMKGELTNLEKLQKLDEFVILAQQQGKLRDPDIVKQIKKINNQLILTVAKEVDITRQSHFASSNAIEMPHEIATFKLNMGFIANLAEGNNALSRKLIEFVVTARDSNEAALRLEQVLMVTEQLLMNGNIDAYAAATGAIFNGAILKLSAAISGLSPYAKNLLEKFEADFLLKNYKAIRDIQNTANVANVPFVPAIVVLSKDFTNLFESVIRNPNSEIERYNDLIKANNIRLGSVTSGSEDEKVLIKENAEYTQKIVMLGQQIINLEPIRGEIKNIEKFLVENKPKIATLDGEQRKLLESKIKTAETKFEELIAQLNIGIEEVNQRTVKTRVAEFNSARANAVELLRNLPKETKFIDLTNVPTEVDLDKLSVRVRNPNANIQVGEGVKAATIINSLGGLAGETTATPFSDKTGLTHSDLRNIELVVARKGKAHATNTDAEKRQSKNITSNIAPAAAARGRSPTLIKSSTPGRASTQLTSSKHERASTTFTPLTTNIKTKTAVVVPQNQPPVQPTQPAQASRSPNLSQISSVTAPPKLNVGMPSVAQADKVSPSPSVTQDSTAAASLTSNMIPTSIAPSDQAQEARTPLKNEDGFEQQLKKYRDQYLDKGKQHAAPVHTPTPQEELGKTMVGYEQLQRKYSKFREKAKQHNSIDEIASISRNPSEKELVEQLLGAAQVRIHLLQVLIELNKNPTNNDRREFVKYITLLTDYDQNINESLSRIEKISSPLLADLKQMQSDMQQLILFSMRERYKKESLVVPADVTQSRQSVAAIQAQPVLPEEVHDLKSQPPQLQTDVQAKQEQSNVATENEPFAHINTQLTVLENEANKAAIAGNMDEINRKFAEIDNIAEKIKMMIEDPLYTKSIDRLNAQLVYIEKAKEIIVKSIPPDLRINDLKSQHSALTNGIAKAASENNLDELKQIYAGIDKIAVNINLIMLNPLFEKYVDDLRVQLTNIEAEKKNILNYIPSLRETLKSQPVRGMATAITAEDFPEISNPPELEEIDKVLFTPTSAELTPVTINDVAAQTVASTQPINSAQTVAAAQAVLPAQPAPLTPSQSLSQSLQAEAAIINANKEPRTVYDDMEKRNKKLKQEHKTKFGEKHDKNQDITKNKKHHRKHGHHKEAKQSVEVATSRTAENQSNENLLIPMGSQVAVTSTPSIAAVVQNIVPSPVAATSQLNIPAAKLPDAQITSSPKKSDRSAPIAYEYEERTKLLQELTAKFKQHELYVKNMPREGKERAAEVKAARVVISQIRVILAELNNEKFPPLEENVQRTSTESIHRFEQWPENQVLALKEALGKKFHDLAQFRFVRVDTETRRKFLQEASDKLQEIQADINKLQKFDTNSANVNYYIERYQRLTEEYTKFLAKSRSHELLSTASEPDQLQYKGILDKVIQLNNILIGIALDPGELSNDRKFNNAKLLLDEIKIARSKINLNSLKKAAGVIVEMAESNQARIIQIQIPQHPARIDQPTWTTMPPIASANPPVSSPSAPGQLPVASAVPPSVASPENQSKQYDVMPPSKVLPSVSSLSVQPSATASTLSSTGSPPIAKLTPPAAVNANLQTNEANSPMSAVVSKDKSKKVGFFAKFDAGLRNILQPNPNRNKSNISTGAMLSSGIGGTKPDGKSIASSTITDPNARPNTGKEKERVGNENKPVTAANTNVVTLSPTQQRAAKEERKRAAVADSGKGKGLEPPRR